MANTPSQPLHPAFRTQRKTVLGILLLMYIINFSDRQLIAVLSPVIKVDLALSDTELGFLKGFAYIIVYALIGIPIAHLADRFSRANIIAISLTVWSAFTALCGLAQNMTQFTLARVGFGIGAAGCSPASHSLLSSYFLPCERGLALAIYSLGLPIGHLIAFSCGGLLTAKFGWRATLITFGIVGLVLVAARLFIIEPERSHLKPAGRGNKTLPLVKSLKLLMGLPMLRTLCLTSALAAFGVSGLAAWIIDFFVRNSQIEYRQVSVAVGLIYGIFGSIGMIGGGYFADHWGKSNIANYLKLPALTLITCCPILAWAIWADNSLTALLMMTLAVTLLYSFQGPVFAVTQSIAPVELRATAVSLMLFAINMAGAGMGPLVVGVISDYYQTSLGSEMALRMGLSTLCASVALAGLGFAIAGKQLAQSSAARN